MLRLRLRRLSPSRVQGVVTPLAPRRRLLKGWSGWFGGGGSDSGESSKGGTTPESEPEPQKESDSKPESQKEYYASCKEAKAAGVAPLYKGDPGYRPELDRDGDGIACETK